MLLRGQDPLNLQDRSIKLCLCISVFSVPQALSTLDSITLMYPFFYRPMFEVIEDGWHSFLPEREFELLSSVVSPCSWSNASPAALRERELA